MRLRGLSCNCSHTISTNDRANNNGVSMEEEARRILKRAVAAPERLGDLAVQIFGPAHGVDLNLEKRPPVEPLDFTK